ncbi:MAG: undecaprenyl-diphosphate phosphatase, partial [Clostridia bacterium]|nr:undecaprenyl-diphosphate phosphatase [Clostridia bacterium]
MDVCMQSLFLGIVQGLTELLPISSSAHLNLIPWMFNWNNLSPSFDVALHFGTLLAIVLFFFNDWLALVKGGYNIAIKKEKTTEGEMFWYITLATIPGGIIGFLLDNFLEDKLKKPLIIAMALIVMGIILYYVDKKCESKIKYEQMKLKETFIIGISQAMAFIPGVSRSGITMTVARLMKIDRESSAKYSFMLSAPIVLVATIFKFNNFSLNLEFFIGVIASFLTGVIVIKFLLEYLKNGSFKTFAVYRIL